LDCIDLVKENELEILKKRITVGQASEPGRNSVNRPSHLTDSTRRNMIFSESKYNNMRNDLSMQPEIEHKKERKPIFGTKSRMDMSPTRNIGILGKDYPIRIEENYSASLNKINPR